MQDHHSHSVRTQNLSVRTPKKNKASDARASWACMGMQLESIHSDKDDEADEAQEDASTSLGCHQGSILKNNCTILHNSGA